MVYVESRKCAHASCTKKPSYGVDGSRTAEFCFEHKKDGLV